MKTILSLISMSALVIGLSLVTGCSKEATSPVQPDSHSYGSASFNIANNFQISIASANSASRAANVADGNYNVNIKNKDNSSSVFASTYSELGEGLESQSNRAPAALQNPYQYPHSRTAGTVYAGTVTEADRERYIEMSGLRCVQNTIRIPFAANPGLTAFY